LIRSVEWLLLVDEAWLDVFSVGTRIYKYFLSELCYATAAHRDAALTRIPRTSTTKRSTSVLIKSVFR
jgi:Nuclear pore protein 84 / 107